MAAEPVREPHRALEIDRVAGPKIVEVGARQRLVDRIRLPPTRTDVGDGHAAAVDGDRVADFGVLTRHGCIEAETAAVANVHAPQLLDYPGEHDSSTLRSSPSCSTDSMRPRQTSAIVAAPSPANSGRASSPPNTA